MKLIQIALTGRQYKTRSEIQAEALNRSPLMRILKKYGGTTPEAVREFNLHREAVGYKGMPAHGEAWKSLLVEFQRDCERNGVEVNVLCKIPLAFDEAYEKPVKPVYEAKPLPEGEVNLYKSVKTFNGLASTAPFAGMKEEREDDLIDSLFACMEGFKHLFIK